MSYSLDHSAATDKMDFKMRSGTSYKFLLAWVRLKSPWLLNGNETLNSQPIEGRLSLKVAWRTDNQYGLFVNKLQSIWNQLMKMHIFKNQAAGRLVNQ